MGGVTAENDAPRVVAVTVEFTRREDTFVDLIGSRDVDAGALPDQLSDESRWRVVQPRGRLDCAPMVVKLQRHVAFEIKLQLAQFNGEAFLIGVLGQTGTESTMHVHAGSDDEMRQISGVHGAVG